MAGLALAILLAQSERPDKLIGGSVEELAAVLMMSEEQRTSLRQTYDRTATEYRDLILKVRRQGLVGVEQDLEGLRDKARRSIGDLLNREQKAFYDALLAHKDVLGREYEKFLYGLPPVTQIRLALDLEEAACDPVQKVADEAVVKIKEEIGKRSSAKESTEAIAAAVNELRKKAVQDMVAAAPTAVQAKVRDEIRAFLRGVEEKLEGKVRGNLDKTMKALEIKDAERAGTVRHRIACILMHRAAMAPLANGRLKDTLKLMLNRKKEGALWLRIADYDTLLDIHRRRIAALQGDLRSTVSTKELAVLVRDRVLE